MHSCCPPPLTPGGCWTPSRRRWTAPARRSCPWIRTGHGSVGVPAEVAVVIATSGSTGVPKGVQLAADALLYSARASLDRIGARAGERWLCPLPASHVAGLGILTRSLVSGTIPVVAQPLRDEADLP